MISMYTKQEIIIRNHREGKSQRQISRELQINRKTIKKYINDYEKLQAGSLHPGTALSTYLSSPPIYNIGTRSKVRLTQEVQSFIDAQLEANVTKVQQGMRKQILKNIDILQLLHEQGFGIGYTTVCNYIREKLGKSSTPQEAFIRQQYGPGSVCEFDWGEIKLNIAGHLSRFHMAVFTPAYSNYRYAMIYKHQDTLAFMESHVSFFEHIGGVYHQMVYDNMRVAVAKFAGKHEKEPTRALLQLKGHYQFGHRFCNAYSGNEKGHVERSVEYIRRKAFGFKNDFAGFEQAQQYLETIMGKLNQAKQQLTGRTAMEMFADEKGLLWQHTGPLACSDSEQLRVDKYATVSYCTNRYSVSEKLVGCFVDVKIFSSTIEAYFENKQVASHQRDYGKHQWVIDIEHYLDTLRQKPGALGGSVALTCRPYLKQLYQQFYTGAPRDFIDLLHYCREHKISEENLEATVSRLVGLCPQSVTTEKLTALLGNKPREDVKPVAVNNQTAYMAQEQLKQVAALLMN
ncbi:MAG: IS21 family transposase [Bacteroidales bacterium]|nr:IS21 family transposase [Bacteroidales bacterium]